MEKLDWTATHLCFSLSYFVLLALLGLLLAYDRERGLLFRDPGGVLIAHIHLALIGFVSLAIFGASYRLVASITLTHLETPALGRWALGLVNAGLLGLATDSLFFGHRRLRLWACVLATGYACYARQARSLLKGQSRDPASGFVLVALIGGAVWVLLGFCLAFGWIEDTTQARAAYIFAALLGWVTPWILGQIHKIAPFLIWLHVYSPRHWKPPVRVPKIEDLTSRGLAWVELVLLVPAIYAGVFGFLVNMALTLRHLLRRDPQRSAP